MNEIVATQKMSPKEYIKNNKKELCPDVHCFLPVATAPADKKLLVGF